MFRVVALILLLVPSTVFALQAGFPSSPIWVSKSSATAGETLRISTVMYNSESKAVKGTLVFTAGEETIGSQEFELDSGASMIYSMDWRSTPGSHKLAAHIESSETFERNTTSDVEVAIAEPPPPSPIALAVSAVVGTAQHIASSSTPLLFSTAGAVFTRTEALREAGVETLQRYIGGSSSPEPISPGKIAGTSTQAISNTSGFKASENDGLFARIGHSAAAVGLFVFSSAFFFYPAFAILVLLVLYALMRTVRRQPRDY